jgi:hypothetical protein
MSSASVSSRVAAALQGGAPGVFVARLPSASAQQPKHWSGVLRLNTLFESVSGKPGVKIQRAGASHLVFR